MHGCAALNNPRCLDDVILRGSPAPIVATPKNVSKWRNATALSGYQGEKALFLHDLLVAHDVGEAWTIVSDANLTPRDRRRGENLHEWGVKKAEGTEYTPRRVEAKDKRMALLYAMRDLLGVFTSAQLADAFNIRDLDIWATAMQRDPDNCHIYLVMEHAARTGGKGKPDWSKESWIKVRRICGGAIRVKPPDWARALAVKWIDEGGTAREAAERLRTEHGLDVKLTTVRTWGSPSGRKRLAA